MTDLNSLLHLQGDRDEWTNADWWLTSILDINTDPL